MKKSRLIVGSALGLAAVAVAIDHTRHRLPEPQAAAAGPSNTIIREMPCGLEGTGPCAPMADQAPPCGLTPVNPCSL